MSNLTTLDSPSTYEKSPVGFITSDEAKSDSQAENQQLVSDVIPAAHRDTSEIPLSRVLIDETLQARVTLDDATVQDYLRVATEAADEGDPWPFPPIQMVGGFLVDGWHRLEVAKRLGRSTILAIEHPGETEDDCILAAVSANASHGLRRSREDVQRAIRLASDAWPDLSAREIARRVQCSPQTVLNLRSRDAESDPVSKLDTPPDSFHADLEPLDVGQGWIQFLDEQSDSTLIARVDGGYRLCRVIGSEVINARLPTAQNVLDALDATDDEYDMLTGMEPYQFVENTTDALEDIETVWGSIPAMPEINSCSRRSYRVYHDGRPVEVSKEAYLATRDSVSA